ncbi:copper resistance D family protein [Mesobacillus foraminis]|uniref:copper resistance D family protein n=1 Tax=Mesobacillus foraminis TaxID=279826 RepID=UPI000EF4F47E|nr:CopD family protein [Mesobacillus foraminis]
MSMVIAAAEWLTYIFFSLLMGHVVLAFLPENKKPVLKVSKHLLLASALGIVFSTFGPVLQVVFYFNESVGAIRAFYAVLTDFQVGHAWLVISWLCLFMMITILFNGSRYLKALLMVIMILAVGYSSHVASLSLWEGWMAHSLHFLGVVLWAGVLLHISWFAASPLNWPAFVEWFSPFATACMAVILITGFWTMTMVVEVKDYADSWVLSYGQTLLLKHIVILPLLLIAFSNAYLSRKDSYNPRKTLKAESLIFLLTIGCTAFLGILSPPHDIDFTVDSEGASPWAEYLAGEPIQTPVNLSVTGGNVWEGVSLLILGAGFLGMLFLLIRRDMSHYLTVLFGLLSIMSLYFGLNRLFL